MEKHLSEVPSSERSWQAGKNQAGNGWSELGALRAPRRQWRRQFPDAAWFSWENSHISVLPGPRAPAEPSLGLVQSTQTCSACPILVLPLSISHPQAVPWENPALSSSFPAGFRPGGDFSFPPRGEDPALHPPASAHWVKPSSRCCWSCRWEHPALFQELHPGILPIHCISRAWERFGMPQLIPGNAGAPRVGTWAEHTWGRGGWHVPAGITHAGRENRGQDGSLGLF